MLAVPAGTYSLGRNDGPGIERPAHLVELPAFRIDRIEVTNAAFAEYLNALAIPVSEPFQAGEASQRGLSRIHAGLLMEGREGSDLYPIIALDDDQARIGYENGAFTPTRGYEDHPVTETTWAGARAYCAWRGAWLPTEAEWGRCARRRQQTLSVGQHRTRPYAGLRLGKDRGDECCRNAPGRRISIRRARYERFTRRMDIEPYAALPLSGKRWTRGTGQIRRACHQGRRLPLRRQAGDAHGNPPGRLLERA